MGSTPDIPMLNEYEDTPFITYNRQMQAPLYNYLTTAVENLNNYAGNTEAQQATVDQAMQSQWDALNENYTQAMNQQAAKNYNRLGTSNSTSNLYSTDNLQNYYNDLATNVSSSAAQLYNQLVNSEYSRLAGLVNTNANLFNNTGAITETVDTRNWEIQNENLDRQYMNDVQSSNSTMNRINNAINGSISGASSGFAATGSPWGAVAGGIAGGVLGGLNDSSSSNSTSSSAGTLSGNLLNYWGLGSSSGSTSAIHNL